MLPGSAKRWLFLFACLSAPLPGQEEDWIPPRSDELDQFSDEIDSALLQEDTQGLLSAISKLGKTLITGVPDGGIPIGPDRWVGAASFLRLKLSAIPENKRARLEKELQLLLEARISGSELPGIDPLVDSKLRRWLLDLPAGNAHETLRSRLVDAAIESGNESTRDQLLEAGWNPSSESSPRLAPLQRPPVGPPHGSLLTTISRLGDSAGVEGTPWPRRHIQPLATGDGELVWLQTPSALVCLDTRDGQELWRVLFPSEAPDPTAGTSIQPTLFADMVVVTTLEGVHAFDRYSGNERWHLSLQELAGSEVDADLQPLSISPPLVAGSSLVVSSIRLLDGRLESSLVSISAAGKVRWIRPLGSAVGATYLALGATPPSLATRAGQLLLLTHRHCLMSLRADDGAIQWCSFYPSHFEQGRRDAFYFDLPPAASAMEVVGQLLVTAPTDSSDVLIFDGRNGELLSSISRNGARFWALRNDRDGCRLAVGSQKKLLLWEIADDGQVQPLPPLELPAGIPPISGNPASTAAGWWIPAGNTLLYISDSGNLSIHGVDSIATIDGITLLENSLVAREMGKQLLLTPISQEDPLNPVASAAVAGNLDQVDLALLTETGGGAASDTRRALLRTVETLLDLEGSKGAQLELERALLASEMSSRQRARRAWGRAWRAASKNETLLASALIDEVLKGPEDLVVDYGPAPRIPIDLAVSALLAVLLDSPDGELLDQDRQRRAQEALARMPGGDQLKALRQIARLHPRTQAGRRARLGAAQILYQYGALGGSLLELKRLTAREPLTAEAVEARLRIIELLRETGNLSEALEEISTLVEEHGDRPLRLTRDGVLLEWTVRQRAQELAGEIGALVDRAATPRIPLPLQPVWRNRTEISHQRSLEVVPLEGTDSDSGRYLTLSNDSVELRSSASGALIWRQVLPRDTDRSSEGILLQRRESLQPPLAIDSDVVIVSDRYDVWCLSMVDGSPKWHLSLKARDLEEGREPIPVAIERSASGDGILVLIGNDELLNGIDLLTGRLLWQQPIAGPLVADPEVEAGMLLLGYALPDRVEIRSIADGSVVKAIDFDDTLGSLADGPWFSGEDLVVPLEKGRIQRISPSGEIRWDIPIPHMVSKIHRHQQLPWFVAELYWSRGRPTLLGIREKDGRILWQRTLHSDSRRLQQVELTPKEIYLADGNFRERRVTCLDIPSGFQLDEVSDELEVLELPVRWTQPLTSGFDIAQLRPYRDWLFVEDRFRCQLTLLSRETGQRLLPRQGFAEVEKFLAGRRRLFFGGFVGDTLCLLTARGALGLRPPDLAREEELIVETLVGIDLQDLDSSPDPVLASQRLFRSRELEAAIGILEEPLGQLHLSQDERRVLQPLLDGLGEELGETRLKRLGVPRLGQAPRIDGSLDEPWNASHALPFRKPRHFKGVQGPREDAANWRGWQDLSAVLLCGWSEEGFHIALDVHDDRTHPYDGEAPRWKGDCLLLAFDLLGDGGSRAGPDDQLLTLALTIPPPQNPDPEVEEGEEPPAGDAPADEEEDEVGGQFQVKRKNDGSGVIYEGTIPWQTFIEAREQADLPYPGLEFGLNLVLTDDDSGQGATSYMTTTTGQVIHQDPRRVWDVFVPDRFMRVRIER